MSKHNPYIPIAEAALSLVLERDMPAAASSMHHVRETEIELVHALIRAFNTEQGMQALWVRAVDRVLDMYGEAVDTGRNAEHVSEHTPETKARRMAMLEQKRAQLDEALARVRNEYAQMTLEDDLTHDAETKVVSS